MSHTPGPWKVRVGASGYPRGIDAPVGRGVLGGIVSVVRQNGIGLPSSPAGHANACLIAATPDLLSAAYVARGMLRRQLDKDGMGPDSWGDDEHEALAVLEAAISKAEGK